VTWRRTVAALAVCGAAALSGCGSHATDQAAAHLDTIRFGVITSGGGAELPEALTQTGIAAKYGLRIQIVPYAAPGQQYTVVRGGGADIVPGNVLDLQRQRLAGLQVHAIASFQRFSSPIVVRAGSPLTSFTQLAGRTVGQFGPTTIDWLTIRAAGKLATGLDLGTTRLTQAPPALLTSLLQRGKIDAAMQFASLAAQPLAAGRERQLTTVPDLLRSAGLDPDSLDVVWDLTDRWQAQNPGALPRLQAAMNEAYQRLKSGDPSLWAPLTAMVGIHEPAAAKAYVAEEISNIDPPYTRALLAPTQRLIRAIIAVAGEPAVGFTVLPASDFLFPPDGASG
jgi:ABC-type nitrate/sulfonate/bicarbonate transport system substrate-binding protein